jgi:hypothetical protein
MLLLITYLNMFIVPPAGVESTVKFTQVLAFEIWNHTSSSHKVAAEFYRRVPKLIQEGFLHKGSVPILVWAQDGLEGVPAAIDYVRQGKHSGQKVVVNIA